TQSIAIPPQQLDQIAATTAKDEDMSREWALLKDRLYCCAQSGETTPQIRYTGCNPDLRPGWHRDHRISPSSAARTQSGSAVPSIRTRACPKSMSMIPALRAFPRRPSAAGRTVGKESEIFTGSSVLEVFGTVSSRPSRYSLRHLNTWFALTSCARATSETDAPGFNVSSTICRRFCFDHDRRALRSPAAVRFS